MAVISCRNCKAKRTSQVRDNILFAFGPKDPTDGLQLYLIYCRKCKHMSLLKPGWFILVRLHEILKPEYNYGAKFCYWMACASVDPIVFRTPIQRHLEFLAIKAAMLEDGLLDHLQSSPEDKTSKL